MSLRTRCVVLKQSRKSEGRFPGSLELLSWNRLHKNIVLGVKRVAVAPFELKIGPNESYGRAASVGIPPGAKTAQIRAKIRVNLPRWPIRREPQYVRSVYATIAKQFSWSFDCMHLRNGARVGHNVGFVLGNWWAWILCVFQTCSLQHCKQDNPAPPH